jgi:hypothetical protein
MGHGISGIDTKIHQYLMQLSMVSRNSPQSLMRSVNLNGLLDRPAIEILSTAQPKVFLWGGYNAARLRLITEWFAISFPGFL